MSHSSLRKVSSSVTVPKLLDCLLLFGDRLSILRDLLLQICVQRLQILTLDLLSGQLSLKFSQIIEILVLNRLLLLKNMKL